MNRRATGSSAWAGWSARERSLLLVENHERPVAEVGVNARRGGGGGPAAPPAPPLRRHRPPPPPPAPHRAPSPPPHAPPPQPVQPLEKPLVSRKALVHFLPEDEEVQVI